MSFNHLQVVGTVRNNSNWNYLPQILDPENRFLKECGKNDYSTTDELVLASSKIGLDPYTNRFHQPIVHHPNYSFGNWPSSHTFPMDKFQKLAEALTSQHTKPSKISYEHNDKERKMLPRPLVRHFDDFFHPLHPHDIPMAWFSSSNWQTNDSEKEETDKQQQQEKETQLQQSQQGPICPDFLNRFLNASLTREECRIIGFREQTHRLEVRQRTVSEVAGTILACQLAWKHGIATNTAGGTHHAHRYMGAGYTILNDLAIAAHCLISPIFSNLLFYKQCNQRYNYSHNNQDKKNKISNRNHNPIQRVLVIDCDVHQGDGTAKFSSTPSSPLYNKLFTLSMHCASNYPRPKAHSTYDIPLPDNMDDQAYLTTLQQCVDKAIQEIKPDFVLYDAGVDVFQNDKLGRLNLTEEGGIRKRDRYVLERCVMDGIPVVGVIGGGYDRDVEALARRHAIVHEEAAFLW
eukprot:CAMPEP_0184865978 /NCGR_PEP_ID=MMETSP0580-20130426/20093_1 /TAXON_ID=1118495 /ORGANISM="Dactyliosolen fragilissimus" /LENGTH=460 /DNA_ID=CAMNT_0027365399 /DNA_START=252 /DNA_END=1630 /DNA_ORIENTATION=+